MIENQLIEALLTGKPYFGPAMRAMQGPPVRHRYLCALVATLSRLNRNGTIHILEIGTWAGASAITWALALKKLGREGKVTCVDQWQPYFGEGLETAPHYRAMNQAAKDDKIFKLFLHNIHAAKVSHIVDYLIGDARKVLPELPGDAFDIVYIDGSHVYADVRADIKEAKRLIRDGGIICGDDLELQSTEVDDREHRAAVDSKRDFVYSTKQDAFYHPGVTEAVAVEFQKATSWEGVWATRKIGQQWATVEVDVAGEQLPPHIEGTCPVIEATEIGQTGEYWLIKEGEKFIAMAKSLGSTGDLIERLQKRELPPVLFAGGNLDEVRRKALESEQERHAVAEVADATDQFNVVKTKGQFVAVAKQLGPTKLFAERLGERELPSLLFLGESLEEVREKALAVERQTTAPEVTLLDELTRYNIVKAGDRFLAVAKELGPTKLFAERLGERELPSLLFLGESLEEVREKALAVERQTTAPEVTLLDELTRYNIVKAGDRFLAVAKELGPTKLFTERLGERELPSLLFLGESLKEVREKALTLERQTTAPEVTLIDEIGRYNIVKAGDRFLAVAKELGPMDLFRERVGERELPPLLLVDIDPVALRNRIAQLAPEAPQHQDGV